MCCEKLPLTQERLCKAIPKRRRCQQRSSFLRESQFLMIAQAIEIVSGLPVPGRMEGALRMERRRGTNSNLIIALFVIINNWKMYLIGLFCCHCNAPFSASWSSGSSNWALTICEQCVVNPSPRKWIWDTVLIMTQKDMSKRNVAEVCIAHPTAEVHSAPQQSVRMVWIYFNRFWKY